MVFQEIEFLKVSLVFLVPKISITISVLHQTAFAAASKL
jgi:hypothetical protein